MILIADSGSTKTDWAVLDTLTSTPVRVGTQGINPILFTDEQIDSVLQEELLPKLLEAGISGEMVQQVFFYGAGCTGTPACRVSKRLALYFPTAQIAAESDLLGAARAVLGYEEGIACILGTGANSCVYDGQRITCHIPPLGYILGDEGSGAVLGRNFLNGILKGWLPSALRDAYFSESGQNYEDVIECVYRKPLANRYLASIVPFIYRHLDEPALSQLVEDNFEAFFQFNVLRYNTSSHHLACVGGMAAPFKNILQKVALRHGFDLTRVLRSPIEGLVLFHQYR